MEGGTAANAARSGGSGTHQNAQKTGSAENTRKVLSNQNGYAYNGRREANVSRDVSLQHEP
jgi:hypothetical protein